MSFLLILKEFKIFYFVRKYFYVIDMFDVVWEVMATQNWFCLKTSVSITSILVQMCFSCKTMKLFISTAKLGHPTSVILYFGFRPPNSHQSKTPLNVSFQGKK